MLIEAKEEDERKKAILHKFYKETEDCLNTMDEKGHALLEADIGNLKDIFASHRRDLEKKGYILLVAGWF